MHAEIIKIDQSYPLDGGNVQNFAVIRLPNGKVIRGEIDDDATTALLEVAKNGARQEAAGTAQTRYVSEEYIPESSEVSIYDNASPARGGSGVVEMDFKDDNPQGPVPEGQDMLDWAALDDDDLSPMMKNIFVDMGVPPHLTHYEIETLVNKVVEGMNKGAEVPQESRPSPRPPSGKLQPGVSWASGQVVRKIPPIRTVQKDIAGNPMVSGVLRDVDPGEVSEDEDGVDSL